MVPANSPAVLADGSYATQVIFNDAAHWDSGVYFALQRASLAATTRSQAV